MVFQKRDRLLNLYAPRIDLGVERIFSKIARTRLCSLVSLPGTYSMALYTALVKHILPLCYEGGCVAAATVRQNDCVEIPSGICELAVNALNIV